MKQVFQRLALGLFLIALLAAILLFSDRHRRVKTADAIPAIALMQFSSRPILDDSARGCMDELAQRNFIPDKTIRIRRFNPENDLATANTMAQSIVDGGYKMVITVSTPCLQTMAAVNREGKVIHVFGTVTDPFGAGVGLKRGDTISRPKHLAGIGTFQPVKEVFRLAKQLYPDLKIVGDVWCTSETCSEACTKLAREICRELDITLVEAPVDTSTAITDAVQSLLSRDVQAIWIGGDNIVEMAAPTVIKVALESGIPVFANAPGHAESGALIGLGADYYQVGRTIGKIAADILEGADPASIPVENVAPPQLAVNLNTLKRLRDPWKIPESVLKTAIIVGRDAKPAPSSRALDRALPGRTYRMGVVYYGPDPMVESGINGLMSGLKERGFVQGVNLDARIQHAQSEIAAIPQLMLQMENEELDVIVPITTPCLTASLASVRKTPLVFAVVYDPVAAGAGQDMTNHLAKVTGVGSFPPVDETLTLIQRLVPGVRKLGTLYNPSEANSSKVIQSARPKLAKLGITLEEVPVAAIGDVYQAAKTLASRGVQAVWITGDNTVLAAFDGIAGVMSQERIPVIVNDVELVDKGAIAAVGISSFEAGKAAAEFAARVMNKESPAAIPMINISIRRIGINPAAARQIGLRIPDDLFKSAEIVSGPAAKQWRIHMIELVESPAIDETRLGVFEGLKASGLVEGRDYTMTRHNAQGDMSLLNQLIDTAVTANADLIYTITTPALQAAMARIHDRPVIFALSVDPTRVGDAGTHDKHCANVAGIYDRSPFETMMAVVRECLPRAKTIGTLFNPGECNSVIFRDELQRAAQSAGLALVALPSQSPAEVNDAAQALVQKGIDAICQINDNLHDAAFSPISEAGRKSRIPVFSFSVGHAREGAAIVVSNDHKDGGRQSAEVAARVMRGVSPADIPYQPISKTRLLINLVSAGQSGIAIPKSLLDRADTVIKE